MNMFMYSIFDSAAGAYARPFCMQSDGQALRAFEDICMDKEHPVGQHPEDYSLARIGVFDDSSGKIDAKNVDHIATGPEMVAKARQIAPGQLDAWSDQNVGKNAGGTQ